MTGHGSRRTAALAVATVAAVIACLVPGRTGAELVVDGTGVGRVIVRDQFGAEDQARYDVFAVKCTRCHAQGRIIDSLQSGFTIITDAPFDDQGIRRYVIRMMRKQSSNNSKADAVQIIDFLRTARRFAAEPPASQPSSQPSSQPVGGRR
jgi:hypothetical protein